MTAMVKVAKSINMVHVADDLYHVSNLLSLQNPTMKVAVEGCCHGELDKIYEVLLKAQEKEGIKIDLLLCCGDFQAVRNEEDLACMAVPQKYKHMQTFYKYYSGEEKAPFLTIFIGGNHEASNHLWELSYGGWVAPNIYYLGNAGVVNYGGLRIGGLSGIYKEHDYRKNHFEAPPYDSGTMRSVYHVRSCDVYRLKQLSGHIDIMLSHDWPRGIYYHGNTEQLLRVKPFFREEVANDTLGSPPAMELLQLLKPTFWFSAHLHVKFPAVYPHPEEGGDNCTKFLALDKCLPKRGFLQVIDVPTPSHVDLTTPYQLQYDPEWLAILRSTEPHMKYTRSLWLPPHPLTDERCSFTPSPSELEEVEQLLSNTLTVPDNFVQTAVPYNPAMKINFRPVVQARENPQTTELCRRIHIANPFMPSLPHPLPLVSNPDEIDIDDDITDHVTNPDEIPLADDSDEDPDDSHMAVAREGVTEAGLAWRVEGVQSGTQPLHEPHPFWNTTATPDQNN